MRIDEFDRSELHLRPLRERVNRAAIERDHVSADTEPAALSDESSAFIADVAERLRRAKESGAGRMVAFGAHTIKNGLSPILIRLMEGGWLTHLATNGAGIIHDWEFAFSGESSEHVAENVADGSFGAWEETGYFLNLALIVGAYRGLGYGESIGVMVEEECLVIPATSELESEMASSSDLAKVGAAADMLHAVHAFDLKEGSMPIPHPFKKYGLQAAAYRLGIPFTSHPMFGHDILYLHPMNCGAAVGRTAERDFLRFANSVGTLEGGVYLSVGSAVMSPMIFEKSLSMAQNLALQDGHRLEDYFLGIVDLAPSTWDWSQGEPPEDHPDYYHRYNKTFSRMGGTMRYHSLDNRAFFTGLLHALEEN